MKRRDFLKLAGLSMAGCALSPEFVVPQHPNIIFILADDLGCAPLRAYNPASPVNTPNIDALASGGLRFEQAYAPAPVCTPTRNCLMTNRHMGRQADLFWPYLQLRDTTLAHRMSAAGYVCGIFGKWGLGVDVPPNLAGFAEFTGTLRDWRNQAGGSSDGSVWPAQLWHNDRLIDVSGYGPDIYLRAALDFIEANRDRPFFCYFSSNLVHQQAEFYPTPGPNLYDSQPWPQIERNFANAVTYLDSQVGAIVNKLADLGLLENTLIVFASDNGATVERSQFWGNLGRRDGKGSLYEGGLRVPLIMSGAGLTPGIVDSPVVLYDLFPTFCDLAMADYTPGDGVSLLPLLQGYQLPDREYFYWGYYAGFPWVEPESREAARVGDWKLVRITDAAGNVSSELFDLASDRGETVNLAGSQVRIVNKLSSIIDPHRVYLPVIYR